MTEELEHDFNELVIVEQRLEKERMDYHLNKDSGMWLESKKLVQESNKLSPNDPYLFDFMCQYVIDNDDNFLREVEGVHFYSEDNEKIVKLTGSEAQHFVENYKIPKSIPSQNMLYSMIYGYQNISHYNVYLYIYFKDTIVDFHNNWRDPNPMNTYTIIPRNP